MKNYYYLVLLIISMFFVSCDTVTRKIPAKGTFLEEIKNKDGSITQKEYSDGKLKSEFIIKDQRRNGPGLVYYPNGKLQNKYNYVKGKLEGESIWYYKSGKVYEVKKYVHHKKHGIQKTYYESGCLKSELEYKENIPQTGLREYNLSGEMIKQPALVITTKNKVVYENKYFVYFSLSDKTEKASFNLIRNYHTSDEYPIPVNQRKGVGELVFNVFRGDFLMEEILIRAEVNTNFGNPLILEKKIRVTAENR